MAKDYECPACKSAVDRAATVCPNATCRAQLAFCSSCRDVTTYILVEPGAGRLKRDRYRCARCEQLGVKCVTWLGGGYCNGLARVGARLDQPFCAGCNARLGEMSRNVLGWSLIGAFGGLFRKPRR